MRPKHPLGLTMLIARGILVNLFDSDWEAIMMVSELDASLIQFAINAWTGAVTILSVIDVIVMWNRDRGLAMPSIGPGYWRLTGCVQY